MKYSFDIAIIARDLGFSGVERVLASLLPFFCAKYKVLLILFGRDNSFFTETIQCEKEIVFDIDNTYGFQTSPLNLYRKAKIISRVKNQYKARVWLSQDWGFAALDLLTKQKGSISLIHRHLYNKRALKGIEYLKYRIYVQLVNFYSPNIISCSEGLKRIINRNKSISESNIMTIYNPVKHASLRYDDIYSSDYDKINFMLRLYSGYLLVVGRLDYQKGILHLLRIYRELRIIGVSYPLVLLGDGPQRQFLENYALQLGLKIYSGSLEDLKPDDVISANVFFFGKVINIDMWLKNARLLLSPSLWEGLPLNMIEALSLGCPVIASDCLTGPREILNDLYDGSYVFKPGIEEMELAKYGILAPVPSGNMLRVEDALEKEEREWVRAVKYALDNTDKLIDKTHAFKKEMLTFFMPENIFRHWERLLDNYI